MKQQTHRLGFFIFFLLAVASIAILYHTNKKPLLQENNVIDSFVNNATYQTFDENGNINTIITAKHATHFKDEENTFFTQPTILTYTSDRTPWTITAYHAKSNDTTDHVFLWEHVIIHQLSHQENPETTIKTAKLTLFPKQSRATTPDNITIYRQNSIVFGKGLIANLKSGEYELLSESEGIYQP